MNFRRFFRVAVMIQAAGMNVLASSDEGTRDVVGGGGSVLPSNPMALDEISLDVVTPPGSPSEDAVLESEVWAQALTLNTQSPSDPHIQNNTEVFAQVGGEATFSCFTHHLSDEMVTWLKRDDDQLLTVGQQVYAAEPRFTASHAHQSKAWELWVKDVQLSDAGQYECQLTTHPPVTFIFTLKVTQAEAIVSGPSEVHIEEGSKLALECHVRYAPTPPVYIFWYHNSTMVNYGNQRTLEVQHGNYSSSLVVTRVRPSDAGTYTCEPHLATPATVTVHVVTGKTPAAMQHGRNAGDANTASIYKISYLATLLLPILTSYFASLTSAPPIQHLPRK